ncbi:MAG: Protein containing Heat shock protein Hsp20 protein [Parcubacteria group bacterium GW2011_GWA1_48_11b]|uniref:Protein containing Heat shock protein Hsp20 protein n=1 Tax=Candidatus Adlerbacteria bacterium GW2011_GWC1_50_9 TaxID=1618608 RepID=A0A0G1ZIH3_9BACT|nr:MAG: Protein containing Heat shock protein Hsp20 protein [Parcubacteria group bacterium GW2011_GWA1_48_11b]KKW19104.1 MAG: Protein containing Heat shock protein Hsp20 protein [Candidatus Adlerbacteria bacterium GW2011_GWC1_50_9]
MASFFEKLRTSMGIEDIEQEKLTPKLPPATARHERAGKEKPPMTAVKKIRVKEENGPSTSLPSTPLRAGRASEEISDAEGELAVDVYQTDDEIVVQSAIAGVKPEDLDITVERDTVTIRGERGSSVTEHAKNYFHQECYWGAFSRQIILPEEVNPGMAEASMKSGILTLRLPKTERQKIKKVQVRS